MSFQKKLQNLYHARFHEPCEEYIPMSAHGSDRKYVRMKSAGASCLGVHNPNTEENKAFVEFSQHFLSKGIRVPEIYAVDEAQNIYLVQDLGDTTLFQFLEQQRNAGTWKDETIRMLYRKVLRSLVKLQIHGGKDLNYELCYPISTFGRQAMMWDLNYFKYCFLKTAKIPFHENLLEKDFHTLVNFLAEAEDGYFLYRDFQSRNIMLYQNEPYFIDYQGGRKGALQYDVASLLFEPKARLPFDMRETLLQDYLTYLQEEMTVDKQHFLSHYHGFVYMRALQALGTYGFRGIVEQKAGFRESIPWAQKNLQWLADHISLPIEMPELNKVLQHITHSKQWTPPVLMEPRKMTVTLMSFSYKKQLPQDPSPHGGGFIFDCRALPNPGRYPEYQCYTGKDTPVEHFFSDKPEMDNFLSHVDALVSQSVKTYMERGFKQLFVAFGCTGGQHRSVYCAEQIAKRLIQKFDIEVSLTHREHPDGKLNTK